MSARTIRTVSPAPLVTDGDGVSIHRAFPSARISELDPFLLLDHLGPVTLRPGEARGFPDHPHRGFETVTYMLEGEFQHRDSFGHAGTIGPGDVQWMTAGSGLVHSETPGDSLVNNGGRLQGFQLWVNLPAGDKMKPPRYQELPAARIPVATSQGVTAHVIAGEAFNVKGAVETQIPIQYLHFKMQAGATVTHTVPRDLNALIYVISGAIQIGGQSTPEFHLIWLSNDSDTVTFSAAPGSDAQVLLLAARPINEPVARYGPFVMNTRQELEQAFADYHAGRMGSITVP